MTLFVNPNRLDDAPRIPRCLAAQPENRTAQMNPQDRRNCIVKPTMLFHGHGVSETPLPKSRATMLLNTKERTNMTSKTNAVALAGIIGASVALAGITGAFGQSAATSPSMKTIGTPSAAAKPEIVPSLFVMNSRGATLQGDTLVLTGVTPSSIIFADRPVRAAGHQPTADVIADWGSGEDSFAKNPPNATVSVLGKDGSVKDAVLVLKNPKLEGDKLTFAVQVLEGDLTGADGPTAVFIDIIGRPLTPLSFAGVARRSAFRGAMYAGAVGAAAYGAAAYAAPYYRPYAPPACGYYPYPPCY